jgi:hypothetical protein
VDDAHFYRADNIEKAVAGIPEQSISILLSHTPEIYRQAAHAGFDLMLSEHTHGGQICSDYARSQTSACSWSGALAARGDGGLHFRRRWIVGGSSPVQQSAGDYAASSRRRGQLIRAFA